MSPNLNRPVIQPGLLCEADFEPWHLPHMTTQTCPPCTWTCHQGRDCPARQPQPAEAATEVGAEYADPQAAALFWGMYLAAVLMLVAAGAIAILY